MNAPCIVLAGGLGTRLRSAVPGIPKCLAPIAGHPFLEWQLRSLAERGIGHFVLALGYGADQVLQSIAQPWARDISIETVIELDALGTGGAARLAMEKNGLTEALVVNGDTFLGGSLETMLVPLDLAGGEFMRIATVQAPDRTRFGGLALDGAQRVVGVLGKGLSGPGPINAGLYRIHRRALDCEAQDAFSIESQVMPRLTKELAMQARALAGPFIDIGVPEDYHQFDTCVHDYARQV